MTARVIVTGSRTWVDDQAIHADLVELYNRHGPEMLVVHGACPTGADAIAANWCTQHDIPQEAWPADWHTHGRAAGPRRNAAMIAAGGAVVLAYIRSESRGASGCVRLAKQAGIPTQQRSVYPLDESEFRRRQ